MALYVSMDLQSSYESVDMMDRTVGNLLANLGYREEDLHRMSVCVREAATNANKHGNREDRSKRMTLGFCVENGAVNIYVGDEGTEELNVAGHLSLKPELLRPDSRGIFFMGQFTDEPPVIEYVLRDGSATTQYKPGMVVGKRIKLVKYLPATSSR